MSGLLDPLNEDDLLFLIAGGIIEEETEAPTHALHDLNRRISGQYVEVLASFASAAFRGQVDTATEEQVRVAQDALERLAHTSNDHELIEVLGRLGELVGRARIRGGRGRARFMRALRAWVLDFSELLEPADAERMHTLVSFEGARLPLMSALAGIRGIGPKRLERLYCAGLFSVEVVVAADPDDVASVTGLSSKLAADVVLTARDFKAQQHAAHRIALSEHAQKLRGLLHQLTSGEPLEPVVRESLSALQRDLTNHLRPQESP